MGVATTLNQDVVGHLTQFRSLGGIAKSRESILQVIWCATVWEIWKEKNNKIFNDKHGSIVQVVDMIKLLTYKWLKVKYASLPFNYHGWWNSPFTLLGIG
ncbi:hypothetical protein MTR_4g079520 [Medicago truncatula]|uniref:Uncharacterized protein n=1 Tax=Medicago truncatula TaxID=3880 RepID=G7JV09_MEDTR|nr:hypothetical protein MTR_4g079520 [Medicago truncatula]